MEEENIKENYISKQKIKAKRIKLIDDLALNNYGERTKTAIKYAIKILSELLGEE